MDKVKINSTIAERLAEMKQKRESKSPSPAPITPPNEDFQEVTAPTLRKLKVERPLKDVTVEVWQDMHYAIKNIATRFGKSEKEIMREVLEVGLQKLYKPDYKEFLDQFKKLFS